MNPTIRSKTLTFITFSIIFFSSIWTVKDYGHAWDNDLMRLTGFVNLKYIIKKFYPNIETKIERVSKVPELKEWRDRHYGPVMEVGLAIVEVVGGMIANDKSKDNSHASYLMRCYLITLLVNISFIFFYKSLRLNNINRNLSTAGLLLIATYPRFFAELHYNTKDLFLVAMSMIAIYYGNRILKKKKFKDLILFCLFCAICFVTRISAVIIFCSFLILYLVKSEKNSIKKIFDLLKLLVIFFIFIIIFFPFLWENPLENLLSVFKAMSNHTFNGKVLYFGKVYHNAEAPWHYIIGWFLITTPISNLIMFSIVSLIIVAKIRFNLLYINNNSFLISNIFIFFGAIICLTIFQNNTYNGWRHSYFIFPSFIIISIIGLNILFKKYKNIISIILIGIITLNIYWISKNHPHQYAFFNNLIKNPHKSFDVDWWGLSNREIIEKLDSLENKKIKIWVASGTSLMATIKNIYPEKYLEKFIIVKEENDADYILNNYIGNNKDYSKDYKLIYEVKVDNSPINSIYKNEKNFKNY